MAEIVWVLNRVYGLGPNEIRDVVLPLLSLPGLRLARKRIYGRVFDLYTTLRIDYIDCYHAALVQQTPERSLYSYDADFDRVPGVTRREP